MINAPAGILLSVLIFMPDTAGAFGAGHRAYVRIEADLQPFPMNVVGQRLDTGWESLQVRQNVPGGVPARLPAVVEIDELITCILHAVRNHCIGGLAHNFLVET